MSGWTDGARAMQMMKDNPPQKRNVFPNYQISYAKAYSADPSQEKYGDAELESHFEDLASSKLERLYTPADQDGLFSENTQKCLDFLFDKDREAKCVAEDADGNFYMSMRCVQALKARGRDAAFSGCMTLAKIDPNADLPDVFRLHAKTMQMKNCNAAKEHCCTKAGVPSHFKDKDSFNNNQLAVCARGQNLYSKALPMAADEGMLDSNFHQHASGILAAPSFSKPGFSVQALRGHEPGFGFGGKPNHKDHNVRTLEGACVGKSCSYDAPHCEKKRIECMSKKNSQLFLPLYFKDPRSKVFHDMSNYGSAKHLQQVFPENKKVDRAIHNQVHKRLYSKSLKSGVDRFETPEDRLLSRFNGADHAFHFTTEGEVRAAEAIGLDHVKHEADSVTAADASEARRFVSDVSQRLSKHLSENNDAPLTVSSKVRDPNKREGFKDADGKVDDKVLLLKNLYSGQNQTALYDPAAINSALESMQAAAKQMRADLTNKQCTFRDKSECKSIRLDKDRSHCSMCVQKEACKLKTTEQEKTACRKSAEDRAVKSLLDELSGVEDRMGFAEQLRQNAGRERNPDEKKRKLRTADLLRKIEPTTSVINRSKDNAMKSLRAVDMYSGNQLSAKARAKLGVRFDSQTVEKVNNAVKSAGDNIDNKIAKAQQALRYEKTTMGIMSGSPTAVDDTLRRALEAEKLVICNENPNDPICREDHSNNPAESEEDPITSSQIYGQSEAESLLEQSFNDI